MELILSYIKTILNDLLPLLPAAVLLCLVSMLVAKVQGYRPSVRHAIGVGLFILFLAGLFSVTVSFSSIWQDIKAGDLHLQGEIDLIPFDGIGKILQSDSDSYIMLNIFGNIAMFLPVGFCLPLLWQRFHSVQATIAAGFLLSFFIEFMQLFTLRATDVDDLLLNTLGTAFGFMLVCGLRWLMPRFTAKFRLQKVRRKRRS